MAPSSTIDKQKLRREREEREQAANASAGRTKRLKLLGLAGGIAAILVCALVLISRSGSDEPAPAKGGGSKPAQVGSLAGIPQHGNVLGDPKAPVTLVEFADLQCPYCGYVATKGALPTVIDRYVRTGKVKVELNLLGFVGPESRKAALVAAAASRQDKMWQFSEAFFANQGEENTGYVTNSFLSSLTAKVPGLDAGKALSQSQGAPAKSIVAHWSSEGHAAQISGTPSFFVRTGDGGATQINVQLDDVGSFSGPLDHALAG